ncbi:hypothetical protein [Sorangium sp. So ce131]|uniref:hypothetical protein n=1 Tax=Sorangium sp. So ce131 TaxID=3133282 RepID=UPI003F63CEA1
MRLALPLSLSLLTTTLFGFTLGVGCSDSTVDGAAPSGGAGAADSGGSASGGGGASGGSGGGSASGGSGGSGGGGASGGSGGAGAGGIAPPTSIATCQGKTYLCGDLIDNDGDGLLDSQDPDCLGPCDNTEDSYYGGIPGQAGPSCTVDCYFDQDSGSGNDDCHWNHQCDPNEVAPGYHPESNNGEMCAYNPRATTPGAQTQSCSDLQREQSDACHTLCGPLTPNGCDCFGCCELPAGSGDYVWLGSDADGTGEGSCSRDGITDPSRCEPCTPVTACLNDCGRCELCLGKDTLPADCFEGSGSGGGEAGTGGGEPGAGGGEPGTGGGEPGTGGGGSGGDSGGQCAPGVQPCGLPGQEPCSAAEYCITGCCQPYIR